MMAYPNRDLTLAMAGMLQSAALVQQLARRENWEDTALHDITFSLIRLKEDTVEKIYGDVSSVDLGLRLIPCLFATKPDADTKEIYRYAASTHQLALKLLNLQKTADVIHEELIRLEQRYLHRIDEHAVDLEIQQHLADLYSRTISFLTPRVIVQGTGNKLQDPDTVKRVRTALFSAIRSAFLWHQCGGRRWQLLFNRKGYIAFARDILNE